MSEPSDAPLSRRALLKTAPVLASPLAGCGSSPPSSTATSTPASTPAPEATPRESTGTPPTTPRTTGPPTDAAALTALIERAAAEQRSELAWDWGTLAVEEPIAPTTDGVALTVRGGEGALLDGRAVTGTIFDLS